MAQSYENRRLVELLYLRDRSMQRLRRSTDLQEVWELYQDIKLLNRYIASFDKSADLVPA